MKKIFTLCVLLAFVLLSCSAQTDTGLAEKKNAESINFSSAGTQTIHLSNFIVSQNKNNKVNLSWTISNNEAAEYFELEKSVNGKEYATAAIIFCSEKKGNEDYMFYETTKERTNVSYRLKMIDKRQTAELSESVTIKK